MECKPEQILTAIPGFEEGAQSVARSIHDTVLEREDFRNVADTLHGVWLEHPLHPALTDFVVGAWVCGSLLDGITLVRPSKGMEEAADFLISLGNAIAVPTALAGVTDFSTIPQKATTTAATHAIMNAGGLVMNIVSSVYRCSGRRRAGMCISAIASSALLVSAWLGGKLTYEQKVGVNRIPDTDVKGEWKNAIKDTDLLEKAPVQVKVDGAPVLIYKSENQIYAMGSVCAHEGGPLHKGQFQGTHVTCPWHQSVYDLRDGHVVHGPATYSEPVYEVRNTEGNLEVKR